MRIAFLTNEFVIEKPDSGGLGSYLNRVSRLLIRNGHEVELFVTRHEIKTPKEMDFNGVKIHHIPVAKDWWLRILAKIDKWLLKTPYGGLHYNLGVPLSLARAFKLRNKAMYFDLVQTSNLTYTGIFLNNEIKHSHILRLSSFKKKYLKYDAVNKTLGAKILLLLEHIALRKAGSIYSPSKLTIEESKKWGYKKIQLLRPPFLMDALPEEISKLSLPSRYLLHFGSIGYLKGSDVIAKALLKVWKKIPEFMMVWVGKERTDNEMQSFFELWGAQSNKVKWIRGLPKSELYGVLKNSVAAVLPSRVDNLPNTVIESLFLGVPVIGTYGSSIDELVVHEKNGALVEQNDVNALAQWMIWAWEKNEKWLPSGFQIVPVMREFDPDYSIKKLLELKESTK